MAPNSVAQGTVFCDAQTSHLDRFQRLTYQGAVEGIVPRRAHIACRRGCIIACGMNCNEKDLNRDNFGGKSKTRSMDIRDSPPTMQATPRKRPKARIANYKPERPLVSFHTQTGPNQVSRHLHRKRRH